MPAVNRTSIEIQKLHIDLHLKHFKNTLLCISDDYAGHNKPGKRFPITDYARSRGITIRDDSIMIHPPPNHWYHADMAQAFWPKLPVILETGHYGGCVKRGGWSRRALSEVSGGLPCEFHVNPLVAKRAS